MDGDYSSHKEYFEKSYQTGTDSWTHTAYTQKILDFARLLPHKGTVLDLGSGRGHVSFLLADIGMKVIGIDFVDELTHKNNSFAKEHGYQGRVAFKTGDILSVPFVDQSFDSVVDVGSLQHLHPTDWEKYIFEVYRVLKTNGALLLVELSRETTNFLNWNPQEDTAGNFENYGVFYHFFSHQEIEQVFSDYFKIIKSETFSLDDSKKYIFTLLQKK